MIFLNTFLFSLDKYLMIGVLVFGYTCLMNYKREPILNGFMMIICEVLFAILAWPIAFGSRMIRK